MPHGWRLLLQLQLCLCSCMCEWCVFVCCVDGKVTAEGVATAACVCYTRLSGSVDEELSCHLGG